MKTLLCACALALLAGCTAYNERAASVDSNFTSATLNHEYRKATEAYDHEDYALAATSFENLADRFPPSDARQEEALFRQGVSYLKLRNFHDADATFARYLERYPSGRFVADVSQNRARAVVDRSASTRVAAGQLEEAKEDLRGLQSLERDHPSDPEVKYRLGNIYYELGQFEEAGRKYLEAQSLEAAYTERDLIRRRMFINAQGQPQVLAPEDIRRLDRERNPLVIFDDYPYRSRANADAFGAQRVHAVVTGKVRNQGSKTLHNVTIEVRYLNAVNDILDVKNVSLGTLGPGEVKAFLARTSRYDNLNNVTRVEYIPRAD